MKHLIISVLKIYTLLLWLLIHFSGYSDQPSVDHCVAVMSFGREIKVLQNFSNDYNTILHILGENCLKKCMVCQSTNT